VFSLMYVCNFVTSFVEAGYHEAAENLPHSNMHCLYLTLVCKFFFSRDVSCVFDLT